MPSTERDKRLRAELAAELGWYPADLDDDSIARHRADAARKKTDRDPAKKWGGLDGAGEDRGDVSVDTGLRAAERLQSVLDKRCPGRRNRPYEASGQHDHRCRESRGAAGNVGRLVDKSAWLSS